MHRITILKATLTDREMAITGMAAHDASKDAQIVECTSRWGVVLRCLICVVDIRRRLGRLETELAEANRVIQRLQGDLGTSTARAEAASSDNDKLISEQQALHDKARELSLALNEARRETEVRARE